MARLILVHGAWSCARSWGAVGPLLAARGHEVAVPDLPGHGADPTAPESVSLADYARAVAALLPEGPPAVLIGHSMAGMVISAVAEAMPERVAHLIYLAAFLPRDGDSLLSLKKREGPTIGAAVIPGPVKGTTRLAPELAADYLFHDATPAQRAEGLRHLGPQSNAAQTDPVHLTAARVGSVPKSYILCASDRTITPALQKTMATETACAAVHTLPTGHFPQLTAAPELAELLNRIISQAA
ncbi:MULTISPECIES: alpha/beta fold hydrolase [Actibacterium]|uniref:Pimeloyl-ACP methyl ester carboxylesterase n=1 Tax=Actibacterium naphthalenivorans TaxID=1614693 RepID=A0A840CD21_9RHOB|nr:MULTISPECIES: alpha/beta hydrolase [Actibacterium]ALG91952.1 hypothetical protein TQ29_11575 [Actibacterium sp. EMB200-NS6]MBB4023090.1 pimeloyl-ACP methyl ester carboxylesterase [Actibacterium naphthalenivorans]